MSNGGTTLLKTDEGEDITVKAMDRELVLIDGRGRKSNITDADVNQSNGVIHVVETVLLPKG